MINWKQKLSSRKFWALLAAVVVSLMLAFGAIPATTERVTGIISAVGACAVYMLAEASVDKSGTGILEAIEIEEETAE
jgi:Na+/H+ antiporter NhaD/arsenite permease-like protein